MASYGGLEVYEQDLLSQLIIEVGTLCLCGRKPCISAAFRVHSQVGVVGSPVVWAF